MSVSRLYAVGRLVTVTVFVVLADSANLSSLPGVNSGADADRHDLPGPKETFCGRSPACLSTTSTPRFWRPGGSSSPGGSSVSPGAPAAEVVWAEKAAPCVEQLEICDPEYDPKLVAWLSASEPEEVSFPFFLILLFLEVGLMPQDMYTLTGSDICREVRVSLSPSSSKLKVVFFTVRLRCVTLSGSSLRGAHVLATVAGSDICLPPKRPPSSSEWSS
mmetsp:Transcript_42099/g.124909  ORF Transcript_42099/g.124909 Transcript_42099/m.124909 type:complete len:218 (-) Transcript_42099:150-803(-)